jgi:hypothetical protein
MNDYDTNNCQLFYSLKCNEWSFMHQPEHFNMDGQWKKTWVNKRNKLLKYQSKYWAQGSSYFQDVILRIL